MRRLLAFALAPLVAACSILEIDVGDRVDFERCARFEPGVTQRAEVLAELGPPTSLARHGDGVALLYEYVGLRERQLGISFQQVGRVLSLILESGPGLPGVDLLKITLGRSGSEREAALFVFAADGTLRGLGLAGWAQDIGKGGSAQVLVSVQNVVDNEAFLVSPESLDWGAALLDPLTATLNEAHASDVELRATPEHVGQRSLELVEPDTRRR